MTERILPKGCPVTLVCWGESAHHRGFIDGLEVQPDGTAHYRIYDATQGRMTHRRRDELTVPRRRDRR